LIEDDKEEEEVTAEAVAGDGEAAERKRVKERRRARERRRDAKKEVATIIMEDGIQLTFPLTVLKSDGTDGLLQ